MFGSLIFLIISFSCNRSRTTSTSLRIRVPPSGPGWQPTTTRSRNKTLSHKINFGTWNDDELVKLNSFDLVSLRVHVTTFISTQLNVHICNKQLNAFLETITVVGVVRWCNKRLFYDAFLRNEESILHSLIELHRRRRLFLIRYKLSNPEGRPSEPK